MAASVLSRTNALTDETRGGITTRRRVRHHQASRACVSSHTDTTRKAPARTGTHAEVTRARGRDAPSPARELAQWARLLVSERGRDTLEAELICERRESSVACCATAQLSGVVERKEREFRRVLRYNCTAQLSVVAERKEAREGTLTAARQNLRVVEHVGADRAHELLAEARDALFDRPARRVLRFLPCVVVRPS